VRDIADVYRLAVHPVTLQPGPVVGEVGADRADQDRPQAELAHPERDVGRDPATPHDQVVHQERQRHLVQLVGQELFGEPTREVHQVVGGDRAGNSDLHGGPLQVAGDGARASLSLPGGERQMPTPPRRRGHQGGNAT